MQATRVMGVEAAGVPEARGTGSAGEGAQDGLDHVMVDAGIVGVPGGSHHGHGICMDDSAEVDRRTEWEIPDPQDAQAQPNGNSDSNGLNDGGDDIFAEIGSTCDPMFLVDLWDGSHAAMDNGIRNAIHPDTQPPVPSPPCSSSHTSTLTSVFYSLQQNYRTIHPSVRHICTWHLFPPTTSTLHAPTTPRPKQQRDPADTDVAVAPAGGHLLVRMCGDCLACLPVRQCR